MFPARYEHLERTLVFSALIYTSCTVHRGQMCQANHSATRFSALSSSTWTVHTNSLASAIPVNTQSGFSTYSYINFHKVGLSCNNCDSTEQHNLLLFGTLEQYEEANAKSSNGKHHYHLNVCVLCSLQDSNI